ncbi:MAG: MotA/TolQ/ExbB proton channel family protein [Proteobacteria bacterium]|nr:MotA/TolQ/ExbB proton channel family protein [Pseudomonadota bacterium]
MSLIDYINKGGFIAYILLIFNIVGISTMLWKIVVIKRFRSSRSDIYREIIDAVTEKNNIFKDETTTLEILKDHIRGKVKELELGLNTVRIIATIAPLLGLLGTVMGILGSFENISIEGMDDPSIFADNISLALITTIGGLMVAVPHYIGYNYLIGFLDNLEQGMEQDVVESFFKERK